MPDACQSPFSCDSSIWVKQYSTDYMMSSKRCDFIAPFLPVLATRCPRPYSLKFRKKLVPLDHRVHVEVGGINVTLPLERLYLTSVRSFWRSVEATAASGQLQSASIDEDGHARISNLPGDRQVSAQKRIKFVT